VLLPKRKRQKKEMVKFLYGVFISRLQSNLHTGFGKLRSIPDEGARFQPILHTLTPLCG